jgi:hypothetical protein
MFLILLSSFGLALTTGKQLSIVRRADHRNDVEKAFQTPVMTMENGSLYSPCLAMKTGNGIYSLLKTDFPSQPRIALIIAESIQRIPKRPTERMERFASALKGMDVFVSIEPEDLTWAPFIKPIPLKVGVFNRTWPAAFEDWTNRAATTADSKLGTANGYLQLLKLRDAFNLIQQHEAERGWKYDIVARLRLDTMQTDICTMGLEKGCWASGAFFNTFAAHVMQSERGTIFHQHDRSFLGHRDDMEKLFNAYTEAIEERGNLITRTHYKENVCEDGSTLFGVGSEIQSVCKQDVAMELRSDRTHTLVGSMLENWMSFESFESFQDRIIGEIGFHAGDNRYGPLSGMDIRRYSYDYPDEGNDKQVNIHRSGEHHEQLAYFIDQKGYASGCAPYPPVGDKMTHDDHRKNL